MLHGGVWGGMKLLDDPRYIGPQIMSKPLYIVSTLPFFPKTPRLEVKPLPAWTRPNMKSPSWRPIQHEYQIEHEHPKELVTHAVEAAKGVSPRALPKGGLGRRRGGKKGWEGREGGREDRERKERKREREKERERETEKAGE